MKRRTFLITAAMGLASPLRAFADNDRILIAYFSQTGNTELIAHDIAEVTGGDLFEIKTKEPIVGDFDTLVQKARQDLASGARPALAEKVPNFEQYPVIFLGFPNWVGTMPMAVFTFIESYDFNGKTVIPFCTHGTSGVSNTMSDLQKTLGQKASILPYFDVYRNNVADAKPDIERWVKTLDL